MVISQVDTDEVVERWQFDIQCENTGKTVDEKGEKRFASATIIGLFKCLEIFAITDKEFPRSFQILTIYSDTSTPPIKTPKTVVSALLINSCRLPVGIGCFQKISIPIPWLAFWNSEGKGSCSLNWKSVVEYGYFLESSIISRVIFIYSSCFHGPEKSHRGSGQLIYYLFALTRQGVVTNCYLFHN